MSLLSWTKPVIFTSHVQKGTTYSIYHHVGIETKWQITKQYLNHKAAWSNSIGMHHPFYATPHGTENKSWEGKSQWIWFLCQGSSLLGDTIWHVKLEIKVLYLNSLHFIIFYFLPFTYCCNEFTKLILQMKRYSLLRTLPSYSASVICLFSSFFVFLSLSGKPNVISYNFVDTSFFFFCQVHTTQTEIQTPHLHLFSELTFSVS